MTSKLSVLRLCFALTTVTSIAACADDSDDMVPISNGGFNGSAARGGDGSSGSGGQRDGGGGTGGDGGESGAGSGGAGSGGSGGSSSGGAGGDDAGPQPDASATQDGGGDPGETMPVIVSSGANHQLALSIDDGMTWCVTNYDTSMSGYDNPHLLRNITYANGWFVSGSAQALFRSQNGYDWEDVTGDGEPVLANWIGQVDFGNGWWVAVGGTGRVMRSMNMTDWEDVSDELPGGEHARTMAFGDGVFVAARDNVGWWQSADGTAWTQRDAGGGVNVYFDGTSFAERPGYDCSGQLCFRSGGMDVQRSTDGGANFSPVTNLPDNTAGRFAFGRAPVADFSASAAIPGDVKSCLGL